MVESHKRTSKFYVEDKLILELSPEEIHEMEQVFKSIDTDKSGSIDNKELLNVFHSLGYRSMSDNDCKSIIKEVDLNNDNLIQYQEFVIMMTKFKKLGLKDRFSQIISKEGKTQFRTEGFGSYSTFSEEERSAYVKVINSVLANDNDCKSLLPINPDSMDLFPVLKNGVILCKLMNQAVPGTIDERVINKKENMNVFLCAENLKLALSSAKAIGVRVIGIDQSTILEQRYVHILGILWQVIRLILLASVTVKKHPQIIKLLKEGEEIGELLKLSPEDILKRWFNYHLDKAGYDKPVKNFNNDLKDSEKYTILLNQLDAKQCDKSALEESDFLKRGQKVLDNAAKLGAHSYITPHDIKNGEEKMNTIFIAEIFNNHHGLDELVKEELELFESAKLLDDDVEGTREERAYRMWINSLGIDDVYINSSLYEEVRSGVLLLKVIDKQSPGIVDWKRVDLKCKNKFTKVVNCNEAIAACKKIPLEIVSTAGPDLHEPNKKLVLGVVWQLMRMSTLKILGNKKETDIIAWANLMNPINPPLKSFADKRLSDSMFFFDLMEKIQPRITDWDIVMKDDTSKEALQNNAKYAISIARKLGATIFLVWEDISESKDKMLMTFTAGLYEVYVLNEKLKGAKKEVEKENQMEGNVGMNE
jgi:plastin-1